MAIVSRRSADEGDRPATLPLHDSVTVIPGLLDFTHVQNTGAAFGLLNAADFPVQAGGDDRHRRASRWSAIAALRARSSAPRAARALRAGADPRRRGRQPDRPRRRGYVVDFVDVYWGDVALLGVQRRRLRDHDRRQSLDASRHARARTARHVSTSCLSIGRFTGLHLRRAAGRRLPAGPAARDGARAGRAASTPTASSTSASTSSSARSSARSCCC